MSLTWKRAPLPGRSLRFNHWPGGLICRDAFRVMAGARSTADLLAIEADLSRRSIGRGGRLRSRITPLTR